MKCKHGLTTEYCSICSPNKIVTKSPYWVDITDKDTGEETSIKKWKKTTSYGDKRVPKDVDEKRFKDIMSRSGGLM